VSLAVEPVVPVVPVVAPAVVLDVAVVEVDSALPIVAFTSV
jgi:hypothetical protein